MHGEKIKVYTYTRVSTAMQIDGYSLDAQKARMRRYVFWTTKTESRMIT